MKIKLVVSRAGIAEDGSRFCQLVGDVVEVADDVGQRMIEKGQATPVTRGRPKKEKAVEPPPEVTDD